MAKRRVYDEEDRARAYVAWVTNGQMLRRTARDTGIPEPTIRRWAKEWEENGPPVEQIEMIAEIVGEFVQDATVVRDEALAELRKRLPDASASALVAAVGMLSDKINMARGLATQRTEHVNALPPAEDIARTLGAALQQALQAAQERDGDIIEAEVVLELPPAK